MIQIQEYKKAEEELKKIRSEQEIKEKELSNESMEISKKYWNLERELRNKKYEEEDVLGEKEKSFKEEIKLKKEPHLEVVSQFKRVLNFIHLSKTKKDINYKVYYRDYPRDEKGEVKRILMDNCWNYPEKEEININPLKLVKDDEFAKIGVYLYENRKPVNKFSLAVIGKTIFGDYIMDIKRYWGLGLSTWGENISYILKEAKTKEELISWFEKNKEKVIKQALEEQIKTEIEYKEVLEKTKGVDWEIAYLESRKDYYENSYSHGTETPEYKEILKQLKKLK